MSVVEQGKDYIRKWTEQERLEWIKAYQGIVVETPNSWVPEYAIDSKKNCCDNCDYFQQFDEGYADGFCMKNISNELGGEFIINSDTFYCSYHKLRINNE